MMCPSRAAKTGDGCEPGILRRSKSKRVSFSITKKILGASSDQERASLPDYAHASSFCTVEKGVSCWYELRIARSRF